MAFGASQDEEASAWQPQARARSALLPGLWRRRTAWLQWVLPLSCVPGAPLTHASGVDRLSGLWQAESCDNYEAYLVACGECGPRP